MTFVKAIAERLPRLAATYRHLRDARRLAKPPVQTPMGFRFSGNPQMEKGVFEQNELRIIGTLLQDSEIFINIGANTGYYCCLALGTGKYTIAFEPIESNLQCLYKNITANNWAGKAGGLSSCPWQHNRFDTCLWRGYWSIAD
jgi:hypothetical protein